MNRFYFFRPRCDWSNTWALLLDANPDLHSYDADGEETLRGNLYYELSYDFRGWHSCYDEKDVVEPDLEYDPIRRILRGMDYYA